MSRTELAAAEAMVRAAPDRAAAWERLGDAQQAEGRMNEAAAAFDRALTLDDRNMALACKLARVLMAANNPAAARHVLAYAETVDPRDLVLADLGAQAAYAMADWGEVERQTRRIIAAEPTHRPSWRRLSNACANLGRYDEACAAFERAFDGGPRTASDRAHLARLAMNALDFERAEATLCGAGEADDASLLAARALLLTYRGKTSEAEALCLRALDRDPGNLEVYPQLSALRNGRLSADEEAPLRNLSRKEGAALSTRATASFILAHSLDARRAYEDAFQEYTYANNLSAEAARREGLAFDAAGADAWTAHIIKTFRGLPAGLQPQEGAPAPIFIIGMPRCGSTLVESVLDAHSEVQSAGEAPMAPPMTIRWIKEKGMENPGVLSDAERRQYAQTYMAGAPRGARRFTDKNLLNIEGVGVLAQVFPAAIFINVRRNPLENGFAIYRQDFLKFWTYATNLDHIAQRYGQYARLVAHWERAYPERFITIQYETFADHFEEQAKRLVAACNLDWEDACRDFHKADRVAATISAAQVREPVKKRAGRAEAYAKYLGPLRSALEKAGVDLETGALKLRG